MTIMNQNNTALQASILVYLKYVCSINTRDEAKGMFSMIIQIDHYRYHNMDMAQLS